MLMRSSCVCEFIRVDGASCDVLAELACRVTVLVYCYFLECANFNFQCELEFFLLWTS